MRGLLTLCIVVTAAISSAQGGPLTVSEANVAMDRVDSAIRSVLRIPASKGTSARSMKAVTRAEVIARLDQMFETYRPQFKMTPRPHRTEPAVAAQFNKDKKTIASIEKLSRFGCLGPVGPLVSGGTNSVSVADLGDALGLFMSQIAALTYTADPKWTPALQRADGGQP